MVFPNNRGWQWTHLATDEDRQSAESFDLRQGPSNYFQDGKYMVVAGAANQPGWGSLVPPDYEKVGYIPQYTVQQHSKHWGSPRTKTTGGSMLLRRKATPVAPAAATPAPEVKPAEPKPVVKPFDPAEYSLRKPEEEPFKGYELNTKASSYEDWLGRREPSGERDAGSWSGIGGDRVERTRRLLDQGVEQAGSSLTADGEGTASTGGDRQRMAGSEAFRSRIDRYRQR